MLRDVSSAAPRRRLAEISKRWGKERYRVVSENQDKLMRLTNARTAEMLTENLFAMAILRLLGDDLRIYVQERIDLPRVSILDPERGVGRHRAAVVLWFIVDAVPASAHLIGTEWWVNDSMFEWLMTKLAAAIAASPHHLGGDIAVPCLVLAFKANIDELRESLSLESVERLAEQSLANRSLNAEPNLEAADVLVLLVDQQQLQFFEGAALHGKTVIDSPGAWQ